VSTLTPGGLPYPETTADINQGANDVKALALALDSRGGGRLVQVGQKLLTFNSAVAALQFPTAFKAGTVPIVMVAGGDGSNQNNQVPCCVAVGPTNTGCTVSAVMVSGTGAASAWATGGKQMNVIFIAIGVAP
jgi:hypothetical protein